MLGGLIHGGAYFRKFTVYSQRTQLEWQYPTLARANAKFVFLVIIVITIFLLLLLLLSPFLRTR